MLSQPPRNTDPPFPCHASESRGLCCLVSSFTRFYPFSLISDIVALLDQPQEARCRGLLEGDQAKLEMVSSGAGSRHGSRLTSKFTFKDTFIARLIYNNKLT